jgi:hypothetical protein
MNIRINLILLITLLSFFSYGQGADTLVYGNTRLQNIVNNDGLSLGGYAQIDYNQPIKPNTQANGVIDVHRLVLFLGYTFNQKLSFISEIEFEHANEVWVEQAYVNYRVNRNFSINTGLLLVPVGIVNMYHEPPTFLGVERTFVDKYLIPTTWREIGIGVQGRIPDASIKYQFNLTNGLMGYDGEARFDGYNGLRGGRQKASKAQLHRPVFNGRIEHYGVPGLKIGLSTYVGASQSTLWNTTDPGIASEKDVLDSSIVQISMFEADVHYRMRGFQFKAQYIMTFIGNSEAYNLYGETDLGSQHFGGFAEVAYDLLSLGQRRNRKLLWAFVRAEQVYTQFQMEGMDIDPLNNRNIFTTGLSFLPNEGVSFKADHQWLRAQDGTSIGRIINLGVGVWF